MVMNIIYEYLEIFLPCFFMFPPPNYFHKLQRLQLHLPLLKDMY